MQQGEKGGDRKMIFREADRVVVLRDGNVLIAESVMKLTMMIMIIVRNVDRKLIGAR